MKAASALLGRPLQAVARFDRHADGLVAEHLRGRRSVDAVMYAASALGDHGVLWMLLAGGQAARLRERDWKRPLLRAVVGLGVESAVVNGPVKWMFRRARPVHEGPRPLYLRTPRSSSFPSGHASAAFFGAALLRDDDPLWPLYYVVAVVVATSRLHVRIHHASDVIAGAAVGIALGELARALVPLDPSRGPRDGDRVGNP
ncbi:phosphatase PAP2 family protein [Acidimicrobiaceae bacterium USS-CC1]|uniref:Phosphatase PAP2 family protein n=1 Tax=Acidiferrimicrobium australe TaxID=2664430 RepID=A0ABW9QVE4_9ACTN|nr:phosphatase PAP2 family protein [Acidiferrimicrobium australe]